LVRQSIFQCSDLNPLQVVGGNSDVYSSIFLKAARAILCIYLSLSVKVIY